MRSKAVWLDENLYRLGPLGYPKVLSSYLIRDGEKYAVVDCGPDVVVDELLELIFSLGITTEQIEYLLLTHIHIDHAGGAGRFASECPNCRVFVPRKGYKYMINPTALNRSAREALGDEIMDYWRECLPLPASRVEAVSEGDVVKVGNRAIRYIPARGHAPHHNVLFEDATKVVFAADSLGIIDEETGVQTPTTPPPSFNLQQAILDIEMVRGLNSKLLCLSHYGEIGGDDAFFDATRSVYETWGRVVHDYMIHSRKTSIESSDAEEIFSRLEKIYPKYNEIPVSLRKQVMRIDVGGLVDYFSRLDNPDARAVA